jgi:hypothetical protein
VTAAARARPVTDALDEARSMVMPPPGRPVKRLSTTPCAVAVAEPGPCVVFDEPTLMVEANGVPASRVCD